MRWLGLVRRAGTIPLSPIPLSPVPLSLVPLSLVPLSLVRVSLVPVKLVQVSLVRRVGLDRWGCPVREVSGNLVSRVGLVSRLSSGREDRLSVTRPRLSVGSRPLSGSDPLLRVKCPPPNAPQPV
ncbi:MAG: hypothetical protein SYR96_34950 [Actinomycetota bacterium]|nr:hypothetical protein [Actinomycetota bacterium]